MRKIVTAAIIACSAMFSTSIPASAANVLIQVEPNQPPPMRKVIVRPRADKKHHECYYKTVKKIHNNRTVITKTKICR